MSTWLTWQYTLTETHVGGAGAIGATDLPIAREATTGLPFLPDTALKGVAREAAERKPALKDVNRLFGTAPESGGDAGAGVGAISFTQGSLLLYPLRALHTPFVYATCPLLIDRLVRMCDAMRSGLDTKAWSSLLKDAPLLRAAGGSKAMMMLEGSPFPADVVAPNDPAAKALAAWITGAFTGARGPTGDRVKSSLVVLPDADFVRVVRNAPPVRARVSLDDETKTTTGKGGNLWYEEMLPSDCLFWSLSTLGRTSREGDRERVNDLFARVNACQIGAGESTGHGRIWWWNTDGGGA